MSINYTLRTYFKIWPYGSALVSTNVVALHRARLVLGWVTVSVSMSGMSQAIQVNSA